jgi:3-mercaptopyruvate sulfurtransferase SseA
MSDPEVIEALAKEIGLRLRRHGITGEERLVLYDRGDGVGAMPSAQLAELAGHSKVSVLLGGIAAWPAELEVGQVELEPVKVQLQPRLDALPTRAEVERRLGNRVSRCSTFERRRSFMGEAATPAIPARAYPRRSANRRRGALRRPRPPEDRVPDSCSRRRTRRRRGDRLLPLRLTLGRATLALRAAGYHARNYAGSWHEWSRHPELPLAK